MLNIDSKVDENPVKKNKCGAGGSRTRLIVAHKIRI